MRRCPLLRQLEQEHQWAVQAVRRLADAARRVGPLDEAATLFLQGWRDEVVPHHRKEEEVLFPDLAHQISEGDALILLPLADHVVLRRLVRDLARGPDDRSRALVAEIEEKLAEHVRFEEQTVFPALEQTLGRACLTELENELAQRRGDFSVGPGRA